jgi:hypothetical protein
MSGVRGCLLLAALAALAGAGLRLAVPVLPPDASLRAVLAFYANAEQRAR